MIKNINDLLNYYNINEDNIPEYVLNFEFEDEIENYGELHTETQDGKKIYVFTSENEVEGTMVNIENILDLNNPYTWTELIYSENSKNPTYDQTIIGEDYIIESKD